MICCKRCYDEQDELLEAYFVIEGESVCLEHSKEDKSK
jgi:hypothetical protein